MGVNTPGRSTPDRREPARRGLGQPVSGGDRAIPRAEQDAARPGASQPSAGGPRGGEARALTAPSSRKLTLTVEEAATLIGISRAQAYRCVRRGQLRAVQLGRRIVVPVVAIEELLSTSINPDDAPGSV